MCVGPLGYQNRQLADTKIDYVENYEFQLGTVVYTVQHSSADYLDHRYSAINNTRTKCDCTNLHLKEKIDFCKFRFEANKITILHILDVLVQYGCRLPPFTPETKRNHEVKRTRFPIQINWYWLCFRLLTEIDVSKTSAFAIVSCISVHNLYRFCITTVQSVANAGRNQRASRIQCYII